MPKANRYLWTADRPSPVRHCRRSHEVRLPGPVSESNRVVTLEPDELEGLG
jgi:hypothetical protein